MKTGLPAPAPAPKSNSKLIKFANKESNVIYYFVKPTTPTPIEAFDAFAVIAVPTSELNIESAIIGEKMMHSVVILIESKSGHGVALEYLSNDFGCVSMSHGILSLGPASKHETGVHQFFNFVPNGFYSCHPIAPSSLNEFINIFEGLNKFDVLNHNCHIFHRSFVATLMRRKFLYNLRHPSQAALLKATTTSQVFHEVGDMYKTREDVINNNFTRANTSVIYSFHMKDLVKSVSRPIEPYYIHYLLDNHVILQSDFGTVSSSFKHQKASANFQSALTSGNKGLLKSAIQECTRYQLSALAEAGTAVLKVLQDCDIAMANKMRNSFDKEGIGVCVCNLKIAETKLQSLGMTGGLSNFSSYKRLMDTADSLGADIRDSKKLMNWAIMNGDVELLGTATAACQTNGLVEEHAKGVQLMELIKDLTTALESNSKVSIIVALEAAEPHQELIGNFWVFKKCRLAIKDDSGVVAVSYRNRRLVILLIIVMISYFYNKYFG